MSTTLAAGLASGSVDATLTEVDARTKDSQRLRDGSVSVGPFGVFSLPGVPSLDQSGDAGHRLEIDPAIDFTTRSISDLDCLLDIGNVSVWDDPFDTGLDFMSSSYDKQIYENPLSPLVRGANRPSDVQYGDSCGGFPGLSVVESVDPPDGNIAAPLSVHAEMTDTEILSHGQPLLRYFRDVVIPTYLPLPTNSKSPWEIMNCCGAVQTLADMTFFQLPDVKHANKANLFGALACSAFTIVETQSDLPGLPAAKCQQIVEHASMKAKIHLQESLRTETRGAQKARYKDQLMAINVLVALAVCSVSCCRDAIDLTSIVASRR